jgi:hypothetical protein
VPKIGGTMLLLIVLILFGVAVIAVASVLLMRQPIEREKAQDLGSNRVEEEAYESLYGRRSTTVSAPVPVERPTEPDVDGHQAGVSE